MVMDLMCAILLTALSTYVFAASINMSYAKSFRAVEPAHLLTYGKS